MQCHSLFIKLLIFSFLLAHSIVIVAAASEPKQISTTICKVIDEKDDSFVFIVENISGKPFETYRFKISGNNLYLKFQNNEEMICLGSHASLLRPFVIPVLKKIIWYDNVNFIYGGAYKWERNFAVLDWSISSIRSSDWHRKYVYLWRLGKWKIDFTNVLDKKNAVNFKLAKILDGKPLTFALIISNDCEKEISVPDFLSPGNKVTIKFPDGKTVSHFFKKNDGKFFKLLPRQSIYLRFDISEFLKRSKSFSMKNFNYGLSEFCWQVNLSNHMTMTKTIKLLKTETPLPEKAKHSGIWMDVGTPLR